MKPALKPPWEPFPTIWNKQEHKNDADLDIIKRIIAENPQKSK